MNLLYFRYILLGVQIFTYFVILSFWVSNCWTAETLEDKNKFYLNWTSYTTFIPSVNSLVSSSSVRAVISDPTRFVPRGHCAKTLIQWLVSSYNIVACPYMPHVYITILKKVVYTLAATSARSGSSLLPSGTLYQFQAY